MRGESVLVAGGAGLVGRAVVRELAEQGAAMRVPDGPIEQVRRLGGAVDLLPRAGGAGAMSDTCRRASVSAAAPERQSR